MSSFMKTLVVIVIGGISAWLFGLELRDFLLGVLIYHAIDTNMMLSKRKV